MLLEIIETSITIGATILITFIALWLINWES